MGKQAEGFPLLKTRTFRCLKCDYLLLERELIVDHENYSGWEVLPDWQIDTDGDIVQTCPRCSAKNVWTSHRTRSGMLRLMISHVKNDDGQLSKEL